MVSSGTRFVCILSGKNYIFEMANKAYIELFAQADVIGKPLTEAASNFYQLCVPTYSRWPR